MVLELTSLIRFIFIFYDDIYLTTCHCMEFESVEKHRSFNDIDVIKCNCIFTFLVHAWNLNIGTMFIACKFYCIKSLFTLLKKGVYQTFYCNCMIMATFDEMKTFFYILPNSIYIGISWNRLISKYDTNTRSLLTLSCYLFWCAVMSKK